MMVCGGMARGGGSRSQAVLEDQVFLGSSREKGSRGGCWRRWHFEGHPNAKEGNGGGFQVLTECRVCMWGNGKEG